MSIQCFLRGHDWRGCICVRCGSRLRIDSNQHVWENWAYVASDSCNQQRCCRGCGVLQTRTEHHWIHEEELDNYIVNFGTPAWEVEKCTRCGAKGKEVYIGTYS